jgi:hypothetical protein
MIAWIVTLALPKQDSGAIVRYQTDKRMLAKPTVLL